MLLLDIHKSNTPAPVIYYPNPADVKVNPLKPSQFFYSSSARNDEVKAAGGLKNFWLKKMVEDLVIWLKS